VTEMEPMGTEPRGLLLAMQAMLRRKDVDAAEVIGYRERSYNIGYCETCSELVTDVRIYYRRGDGTEAHYQVEYTDLGELIRKLTDIPDEQHRWGETATREPNDQRWGRASLHSFDEEPDE
jgi:hypothetical protein